MWAGRLCPDGLALVGRDSVEPEGRCRFTRPCAFFSSTESRPADEEFVFNFAALLAFGDLMLQRRNLLAHLAQLHVPGLSARFIEKVNDPARRA